VAGENGRKKRGTGGVCGEGLRLEQVRTGGFGASTARGIQRDTGRKAGTRRRNKDNSERTLVAFKGGSREGPLIRPRLNRGKGRAGGGNADVVHKFTKGSRATNPKAGLDEHTLWRRRKVVGEREGSRDGISSQRLTVSAGEGEETNQKP